MRAQRLTEADRPAPPLTITRDPDKVNLDPGDVRKIPRAGIPIGAETRGELPPRRSHPAVIEAKPEPRVGTAQPAKPDLLPLDVQILAFCAVPTPEPAPQTWSIAHEIGREIKPTLKILDTLNEQGYLERTGQTRGTRWRTTPAGMLRVRGDLTETKTPVVDTPAPIRETKEPVSDTPRAEPVTVAPPAGIHRGPLPKPREIPRGGGKQGRYRVLAGQISKREDWFVWEGGGKTQAAQVRRWAKLEKLPIDRYYDDAGRLIVCHRDAEVLRAV